MLGERPLGGVERCARLAACRGQKRVRPCGGRECPRPVEARAVLLELGGQFSCLVELTERDECLDRVRVHRMS